MNLSAELGLGVVLALAALLASIIGAARIDARLKTVLLAGLALRLIGAIAYYAVISAMYGGGDYMLYVARGQAYAERMRHFDFAMFADAHEWLGGKWWGTQFVIFPAGIMATLLGPSVVMQFVAFGLLSFVGLLCFGTAFRRVRPDVRVGRYLRWILLFPALWFWPSAPGKDSLILLGAGLTTLGYAGRRGRMSWPFLGAGLLLIFAVRPQVAMVFLTALVIAHWLGLFGGWTMRRVMQGVALGALAVAGIAFAMQTLGIEEAGAAGIGGYMEARGRGVDSGGSDVQTAQVSWRGVPLALVNIWLRPFPWEPRSVTAMLSAIEIAALWGLVWLRHRQVSQSLANWRGDRLLRLAMPFLLLYSVSAGMTMWNLGIIARQRIVLFPFLFLLLEPGRLLPRPRRGTRRWFPRIGPRLPA